MGQGHGARGTPGARSGGRRWSLAKGVPRNGKQGKHGGNKATSQWTVLGKGEQTHLLLGPTNGLQVADQSLLALLQRLLQVLEGCADLGQGLGFALLQLLADAPH